jgi:hypothetical protein
MSIQDRQGNYQKYNSDGSTPVQLVGSLAKLSVEKKSRAVLETLLNAVSVSAGGLSTEVDLGITDESEVWLIASIDQQPWSLKTGVAWATGALFLNTIYPLRNAVTSTFSTTSPAVSLYLGQNPLSAALTTTVEARATLIPPSQGVKAQITNSSASIATVTLKIIRVWR